jgi:penicillin-binding protein 2
LASNPPVPGRFLPRDPRVEEPYRLTPQLALRITVLGMVVLAAFAVLFLRLWALQVLSGSQYLDAAQNNQLRTVRLPAPRGLVLDRNGVVLVENVAGNSVEVWPADLPKQDGRHTLLVRLSRLLGVPVPEITRQIARRKNDPLTPVTLKRDVPDDKVRYLYEHRREFPGVVVAESYLRSYPRKAMAAQVLGHVGEASQEQLDRSSTLRLGDEVGQGGIEASYDAYLRGRPGAAQLRVDSLGRPRTGLVPTAESQQGNAIRLSLDVRLQRAAERALRDSIALAIEQKQWYANGGAIVALDPRDGEILALASNPTYKPSVFVGRTSPRKLAPLLDPRVAQQRNYPGLNRAIDGLYPPGSTFKPVTALAALEEHVITPYESLPCTGEYEKDKQVFKNWDPYVSRAMTLPEALEASCDTYFYELGYKFYSLPPERGHPLQDWASRFGFGESTGVDVGPDEAGLLPTPEWREQTYTKERYPHTWEIDRLWKSGDSIQLAIGQKDLLVTPLQMARFYAMIANGGRVVTPHLALDAEQPGQNGADPIVRQRFTPPAPQPAGVDPTALQVVRDGLYRAANGANGTATGVFGSFPVPIAGKTGTAEKYSTEEKRMLDQAWWCGYGPSDDPELVVCALIENGGHGGDVAAPAALKVFESYFHVKGNPILTGHTD